MAFRPCYVQQIYAPQPQYVSPKAHGETPREEIKPKEAPKPIQIQEPEDPIMADYVRMELKNLAVNSEPDDIAKIHGIELPKRKIPEIRERLQPPPIINSFDIIKRGNLPSMQFGVPTSCAPPVEVKIEPMDCPEPKNLPYFKNTDLRIVSVSYSAEKYPQNYGKLWGWKLALTEVCATYFGKSDWDNFRRNIKIWVNRNRIDNVIETIMLFISSGVQDNIHMQRALVVGVYAENERGRVRKWFNFKRLGQITGLTNNDAFMDAIRKYRIPCLQITEISFSKFLQCYGELTTSWICF